MRAAHPLPTNSRRRSGRKRWVGGRGRAIVCACGCRAICLAIYLRGGGRGGGGGGGGFFRPGGGGAFFLAFFWGGGGGGELVSIDIRPTPVDSGASRRARTQAMMAEPAVAFLALPGGPGTRRSSRSA